MSTFQIAPLAVVALLISGCQTWQPRDINSLPPTASAPESSEPGHVNIRYWMNVPGAKPEALTQLARYPNNPDDTEKLQALEQTQNRADDYGAMIQGFIIAPQTGFYKFFLSADDQAELWLSDSAANEPLTRIATVPAWTYQQQYDKYASQTSPSIQLQSGQRYYFRVIFKERSGDDHFSVAWEGPGLSQQVVSGTHLSSWYTPVYPSDQLSRDAYGLGYRIGFFDGNNGLSFVPDYPPLDQDQDMLYDNWEAVYQLSTSDSSDANSDFDNDLLTAREEFLLGIDPTLTDSDSDGIPDGAEYAYNLNPRDPLDAAIDSDGDGASNLEEYMAGTDFNDPQDTPAAGSSQQLIEGFTGQYYAGANFDNFIGYRSDNAIAFRWGKSAPMEGVPVDNFSVRWIGRFEAPHTAGDREYEFSVRTDDGVRLYLGSDLVIDQWVDRGPTTNTYTRTLAPGAVTQVKMEYYDAKIGALAELLITDAVTGERVDQRTVIRSPDPASEDPIDSDNDGLPDSWELRYGTDLAVNDSQQPVNTSSNITYLEAFQNNLNPITLEPLNPAVPETPDVGSPPPDEIPVSSVSLSWTPPDKRTDGEDLDPAEISHYEIRYGLESTDLDQSTPPIPSDQTSYVIDNLERGIWYFNIRVYDKDGLTSPPSNTETFQIN